jgi:HEAT repeat protein
LSKPTADELQKLMADLKSADIGTRRSAAGRLSKAELDSSSPDLLERMASLSTDGDNSIRQSVASFLNTYGTTNQVPSLLKLLKDSDWMAHQTAIKALGRIKDERAIEPLTHDVARGGSSVQDASSALIRIGSPAEKAVLQLLNEGSIETRRHACRILQQIGTSKSIEPLQDLVGDPDQSLSQTAVEAIRAIEYRE